VASADFNSLLSVDYASFANEGLGAEDPLRSLSKARRDARAHADGSSWRQSQAVLEPQVLELNHIAPIWKIRRVMADIGRAQLGRDLARKGDLGQVEQVIMNLVVNARDAMLAVASSRSLRTTSGSCLERSARRVLPVRVSLTISDTGSRMDAATLGACSGVLR
jgi:signal transduction histidine kinase